MTALYVIISTTMDSYMSFCTKFIVYELLANTCVHQTLLSFVKYFSMRHYYTTLKLFNKIVSCSQFRNETFKKSLQITIHYLSSVSSVSSIPERYYQYFSDII